jgi:hypothetical protein
LPSGSNALIRVPSYYFGSFSLFPAKKIVDLHRGSAYSSTAGTGPAISDVPPVLILLICVNLRSSAANTPLAKALNPKKEEWAADKRR